MYIKLSSFLVVGLKRSGYSITKVLLERKAEVYVYDSSSEEYVEKNKIELQKLNAKITVDPIETLNYVDVLVLSPGVPIDSEISITARKLNKRIIGEMELASYLINAPIVAITGTNGKTTVCSILSHVLNSSNEDNVLVGNIGTPLSSKINEINENTLVITEVSSFQLETTSRFCPHIACILNITPDHLDRHYNMQNYIFLKGKLLSNLKESEFAVLNYDNESVRVLSNNTRANVVWFSKNKKIDGAYLENGEIFFNDEQIFSVNEINLLGIHNVENVLACVAVLKLLGITNEEIKLGVSTFTGVKHRIQHVKTVGGVDFYNDSKSTNPDATIKAVNSMQSPTVLIMGGYEKGLDYGEVMKAVSTSPNIENLILTGKSANKMYETAVKNNVKRVNVVSDFNATVKLAYALSKNGGAVLFSPATSSFDKFSNYEERGDRFIEAVNEL